ncbi:hypothetical protein CXB51_003730 [Gossypium anomalum]|uniref:DUF7745 domain-containing protein n=1 Tax=Gossypium anomalum TaxID=47600 RepID=A0A8J5ZHD9_9ROSI|nr:hypothetical protein CXB51_003730 [Gossypium anomalum]
MSEPWVTAWIQQKGDSKCIPWENVRDLVLTNLDKRKRVDIFALSIYGLVIFPKALRHVDEAVIDLFDRLEKGITRVPAILAETFRSLSTCWKTGRGGHIKERGYLGGEVDGNPLKLQRGGHKMESLLDGS